MKSHPVPQPTPIPLRRDQTPLQAFSLIETALALGIVAFAFVGLMGLLPAGLGTFRTAIDTTVSAQIVQRIVSDAEQSDFDALSSNSASSDGTPGPATS